MRTPRAKLYMCDKIKHVKKELMIEKLPHGYLYADGRFPTKILPEDLPEWYVFGYMYKRHGYLSAKGVKHLLYKPNYWVDNHCHKYDTLYISYDKPIEPYEVEHGSTWYKGYDHAIGGNLIYDFVKAAGKFSSCDVSDMLREIEKKRAWYYENNPDHAPKTAFITVEKAEIVETERTIAPDFGRRLPYRGNEYILGGGGDKKPFFDNCFCVYVNHPSEKIKRDVEQIYRDLARKDLTGKVRDYALNLGVNPPEIKLIDAKTALGRCFEKGGIAFSWRVVMGKDEIIDYVVVSTLAQLVHPNYTPEYWALIESVLPDYEERRESLRYFIERLKAEEWL